MREWLSLGITIIAVFFIMHGLSRSALAADQTYPNNATSNYVVTPQPFQYTCNNITWTPTSMSQTCNDDPTALCGYGSSNPNGQSNPAEVVVGVASYHDTWGNYHCNSFCATLQVQCSWTPIS
jgi:hypothetical protein